MKRIVSWILMVVMVCVFGACTQTGSNKTMESLPEEGKLFGEDTRLEIVIDSFVSMPYDENWKMWQYLKEAAGGDIQVTAFPGTEYDTKVALLMAVPEDLPDLLYVRSKHMMDTYALSGAFIALDENQDKLQNYNACWESVPEEERKYRQGLRMSGDGKIYYPQIFRPEALNNHLCWMYRQDIFEKNGISIPQTMEELYEVSRRLKGLYPESYPVVNTGLNVLATMGPQWKPYFQQYVYYDYDNGTWHFGATEQTMLDMLTYWTRMYREKLIAPDFLTMNTKTWEELISTDRGFIMLDYVARIDYFNNANALRDEDYQWAFLEPPRASEIGKKQIAATSPDSSGYAVCNTRDDQRIANAFRLLDWMYTDEAMELLSWGKEGETYYEIDGKRHFLVEENELPRSKYGVFSGGLHQRIDPAVSSELASQQQMVALEQTLKYMEPKVNPKFWMAFSDEEFKRREQIRPAIETYTQEMISKFLLGQIPLSQWDGFQKNLSELGIEELLDIHKSAYQRVLDASK